jgi:glycosyltransferase involved in cell wall biosynthesis
MRIFYFAAVQLGLPNAANRHIVGVCNHLARRGHEIWLFVPACDVDAKKMHPEIHVVPVPAFCKGGAFFTTLSFFVCLPWYAWRVFLSKQPTVVYTRATFLDWLAILPLRTRFRFSYTAEINGIRSLETTGGRTRQWLISWQEKLSLKLCDKVVAVTPELNTWAAQHTDLPSDKIQVISNGVDTDLFQPMSVSDAKSQLGLDTECRYVTFVGSLKPWHDIETMLRAFHHIQVELRDKVHLLVVGDGPDKEKMQDLGRYLGLDRSLKWIGLVESKKVPLYINAGDLGLAPFTARRNRQTGISPIKIYEYMSCGRPFVATYTGTQFDKDFGDSRYGKLVPLGNPPAFADAVVQLMRDPEERVRLGHQARQKALQQYSWVSIAKCTEEFIAW